MTFFLYFQSGKHDAIVKNVHDLLAKLAWDFSPEQLDHLFECFQVGCYFLQWHAHPVSSQVQLTTVIVCITYPQSQTHHLPSISSIEGKSPAEPEDCCLQGVSHGKYWDQVVIPNMNFTNTQIKKCKYPIYLTIIKKNICFCIQVLLCIQVMILKNNHFLFKPSTSVIVCVEEWLVYFIWHC